LNCSAIDGLSSADEAALWAQRRLVAKNQLSAADAQQVEEAFAAKLAVIPPNNAKADDVTTALTDQSLVENPPQINKSVLEFPEPRRIRDRDHIRHVIKQPCLICGRRPSDPHHLRSAQSRALGRKVSDEFTVPLCRGHHREVHRSGDEAAWWTKSGIDPTAAARALWLETHPLRAMSDKARVEEPTPVVVNNSDRRSPWHDRPSRNSSMSFDDKTLTGVGSPDHR
jgi:hypothetical protein